MGSRNVGRWAAGALCAAMLSFAHAQPPRSDHGGGGYHAGGMRAYGGPAAHAPRADSRGYASQRRAAGPRQDPRAAAGGSAWMGPSGIPGGHDPVYGTPIRTVSEVTRPFQRQDPNPPYMRSGSIRADITRYNEERESSHFVPRPPNQVPHPPEPSPYRN
ncbi:peptide-binding protein [Trinickia violacea]|uniref:Peptide-binding protein n=1 Tax=Trinickia violacea TaxID=2571746 RepID=A0A4P8IJK4_9BURK|nr:peptide-binding protein [Trinickia violacea]QCP47991.1 peptide-binding protein [Trinickia violacea]